MKKKTSMNLNLIDIRQCLRKHYGLPSSVKFHFNIKELPDPQADIRDPSFIHKVKSISAVYKEKNKTVKMTIPVKELDALLQSFSKTTGTVSYKFGLAKSSTADVRDNPYYTVVVGAKITN